MSDLLDDPIPGQNTPEYTVSEISGEVKKTLEGSFGRIRVRGEVGRVFKARSGHLYYDVKDDRSVLACTTWKGQIAGLSVVPEEGLEVVVTGRLTALRTVEIQPERRRGCRRRPGRADGSARKAQKAAGGGRSVRARA